MHHQVASLAVRWCRPLLAEPEVHDIFEPDGRVAGWMVGSEKPGFDVIVEDSAR
jgi:hypothetical protein